MITTEEKKELTPNKEQQKCIDNIEGQYLVLAGPGTGKTFTVIQKIKAMLDKQIAPEKILCLTFSDAAADEMRKKMEETFGTPDIPINIYTYHSFCNEIISESPEEFELPENYHVINPTIQHEFLKEDVDEYKAVYLRSKKNDPYSCFTETFERFTQIKRKRLTKEQYFHNLQTNEIYYPKLKKLQETKGKEKDIAELQLKINKMEETWSLYELYKAKMEKEHYIDFDDMITLVLNKFETAPSFLNEVANRYEYIMVDEYQDTNELQNLIVFNLVSALETKNIFVVGDDDQIIYSFQGANLDTIQNYLTKFPETKIICLKENMRSTQSILDVAMVIANQDTRRLDYSKYGIDKNLVAKNEKLTEKNKKVRVTQYNNQEHEYIEIVNEVSELINSEDCPKDKEGKKNLAEIAVLMTSNDSLKEFSQYLFNKNIPFELKNGKSIFEIKSSTMLLYYLRMIVNPEMYSDTVLKLLLLPPYNINPCDFSLFYERSSKDKTYIQTLREIDDWIEPDKIENFLNIYDELSEFNACESVKNTVLEVVNKTGMLKYYLNEEIDKAENIGGLKKMIDEAADFSEIHNNITLEAFVDYLNVIQNDRNLDITIDKPPVVQNAIQLLTYHGSKGREFEYVYLPSLSASKWESSSASFKPKVPVSNLEQQSDDYWKEYKKSDRVKNMYVGMTRAKHTLRLSYLQDCKRPSKWITTEIAGLTEKVVKETFTNESYYEIIAQQIQKNEYDYKRDFNERVNCFIKNKKYSPTEVNNYLSCPKKYLYGNVLDLNPRVNYTDSLNALNYGNAVHNTCEEIIEKAIKENEYPSKEFFLEVFNRQLDKLAFTSREQREILK
ncbi:MAG: ATP-dependent helicase, partial [Candidatus Gastranaerophilales bacterium]|nr:ATP-dependent helicase [Candidatus Gastranaerophilales bacterium]